MKLGIVMDPLARINPQKDSSFAMLLEAQARAYKIYYIEPADIWQHNSEVLANATIVKVADNADNWFTLTVRETINLANLNVVLIRKNPPFDSNYLYLTQMLELVEKTGNLVVNQPAALRNFNEKLTISLFPELAPPTCVSAKQEVLREFLEIEGKIVVKPLDAMGGRSIFVVEKTDTNANVILETITDGNNTLAMAQKYINKISEGDKRVLLVNGKAVPFVLARIPGPKDFRGNLARGAIAKGQGFGEQEDRICKALSKFLRDNGLVFVGIDIIGEYLTEINITSPTGIRELDKIFALNIAGVLFDAIESKLP